MKKQKNDTKEEKRETIVVYSEYSLHEKLYECRISLLMSTHSRLGQNSPMRIIGKDVVRHIAKNYFTISFCISSAPQAASSNIRLSAEVNTTEEEECKSWVSTVHKYPDLDPMMAVVKNKKSRSLQLLRSHFCNVTYVDRHFFEHEPFHFETPLMVLRQKGVTLFSFSINGDDMGRFHPFFEWLDKMDKAIDSSLRNLHSNINNPTFRPSVDSLGISNCIFAIGKSDCCVTLRYPSNPRLRFTLKEIIDGKMLWTFRPLKLILSMDRAYDKIDNAYFTRFHIVEMILY